MRSSGLRVRRAWLGPALIGGLVLVVVSAGAVAALETGTVGSFWQGMWWSISLITTIGFVGEPPETVGGALVSVVLMVAGILLLAMVSAAFASLFVREDTEQFEREDQSMSHQILEQLTVLAERVAALESRLPDPGASLAGQPPEPDGTHRSG